jgi:hypothetical protein
LTKNKQTNHHWTQTKFIIIKERLTFQHSWLLISTSTTYGGTLHVHSTYIHTSKSTKQTQIFLISLYLSVNIYRTCSHNIRSTYDVFIYPS